MQPEMIGKEMSVTPAAYPGAARHSILRILRKELALFFASPMAWLFLFAFVAAELFVFFWAEAFFARNIADIRPLFQWLPLLLLFLASALTMRQWSDERRHGTLEHILTSPQPLWHFIVAKFASGLCLLALALLLTLPIPLTVSALATLDWGPVLSGYLAAVLLGSAYLAIGLFISARTDNAIVALIGAVLLGLLFYLPGTPLLSSLLPSSAAEWLRLFSTSARFDAITRGVIDLRDLYYYLALIAVFLLLTGLMLDRERWALTGRRTAPQRLKLALTALLVANIAGANLWLGQLPQLRLDTTAGAQYSLSEVSKQQLAQLQEPLLIRGYFSANTHPLLAPLVPQLQDLLKEYQVAGRGKVRLELVDPTTDPALEQQANQQYGIEPVPFQVADRHQASIVSSYFHLLLQYGSERKVLSFRDLIGVKSGRETELEVQLRNPEYDLTRQIKTLQAQYQTGGDLLALLPAGVTLNAYLSADAHLPQPLQQFAGRLSAVLDKLRGRHTSQLQLNRQDPAADALLAERLASQFGAAPVLADPATGQSVWFLLTVQAGERELAVPLEDLTETGAERDIKASLQRLVPGLTKTVALVSGAAPYGNDGSTFNQLRELLGTELNVQNEDLSDGKVSAEADVLVLLAPKDLTEKQVFAVDQFLMQGGTVIAATSPFDASLSQRQLALTQVRSGLEDWLAAQGLQIEPQLVLDPQHSALPVPITREVGGMRFQQMAMLPYPYFADIRADQFAADQRAVFGDLPQLTAAWSSPIVQLPQQTAGADSQRKDGDNSKADPQAASQPTPALQYNALLRTSAGSWQSNSLQVMPVVSADGQPSYPGEQGPRAAATVAMLVSGEFRSFFAGKPHPLQQKTAATDEPASEQAAPAQPGEQASTVESQPATLLSKSAPGARLFLLSSNAMFSDQVMQLAGSANGSLYLNNLQLLQNLVSVATADTELASIRSRAQFNRTLPALSVQERSYWEYLNYALALLLLALLFGAERLLYGSKKAQLRRQLAI